MTEYKFKKIRADGPRYVKRIGRADYSTAKAQTMIKGMLEQMRYEISQSEKSSSVLIPSENSYQFSHRSVTKSTFPEFLRETKIGSRKAFMRVLASGKGKRFQRLKEEAIDRLERGYRNSHGYDEPSKEFMVASKQLYDNKDIIFRRIRGKIVPLRIKKKDRYDHLPDAPF